MIMLLLHLLRLLPVLYGGTPSRGWPRGTITNPDVLRRDLAATRTRGYALSYEETDESAAGISVPTFDRRQQVVAGLAIAGPKSRFTRSRTRQLLHLAQKAAAEISRALGAYHVADRTGPGHPLSPPTSRSQPTRRERRS